VAPAYAGVDSTVLNHARDGAVVPIAEHAGEIVLHTTPQVSAGVSWEPIRPTPAVSDEPAELPDVAAEAPELYRWDRDASPPVAVPADAYSLRLVAARTLYDAGRTVASSPSLASLAAGPNLVVHPNDLPRVGVAAVGATVRVTSARGSIELPVQADTAIAPGTCFIAVAQDATVGANDVVDVTASVTELRVETTR
jgi:anaerobic selenocysteine-containing dehydrogenase